MIMVGPATTRKLNQYGIYTLGDLANSNEAFLKNILGKNGILLRRYACGEDMSPVRHKDIERDIKSVARRMRNLGLKGTTLSIYVRDKNLGSFIRQCKLPAPTNVSGELIENAMRLFIANYDWKLPIRSLGITVTDFDFDFISQFDFSKTIVVGDSFADRLFANRINAKFILV